MGQIPDSTHPTGRLYIPRLLSTREALNLARIRGIIVTIRAIRIWCERYGDKLKMAKKVANKWYIDPVIFGEFLNGSYKKALDPRRSNRHKGVQKVRKRKRKPGRPKKNKPKRVSGYWKHDSEPMSRRYTDWRDT